MMDTEAMGIILLLYAAVNGCKLFFPYLLLHMISNQTFAQKAKAAAQRDVGAGTYKDISLHYCTLGFNLLVEGFCSSTILMGRAEYSDITDYKVLVEGKCVVPHTRSRLLTHF